MIKPILWAAGATAVVGALTFVGLTALGVDVLNEGTAQETVPDGVSPSRDNNRVAICVEAGGELTQRAGAAALQSDLRDVVEETIAELTQHKHWHPTATPRMDFVDVDAGCPADPHLDCPEDSLTLPIDCEAIRPITQPSEYRLFVFVLSDDDLEKATLGLTRRHGTQEVTCAGDVCDGVTGNVYISETEAADPNGLYHLLAEGLGLEKARDDDPDDGRGDDD